MLRSRFSYSAVSWANEYNVKTFAERTVVNRRIPKLLSAGIRTGEEMLPHICKDMFLLNHKASNIVHRDRLSNERTTKAPWFEIGCSYFLQWAKKATVQIELQRQTCHLTRSMNDPSSESFIELHNKNTNLRD